MPSSSSLTTGPAVPARAYAVLIMLFLFQTINFFDKLVFGLSAVPMMKELSLSPKEFGLIGSSFFLLFSLSGMAVGLFVVGRFPVKWILMLLAAIWSATQLPVFFSSSVMVLVVCVPVFMREMHVELHAFDGGLLLARDMEMVAV